MKPLDDTMQRQFRDGNQVGLRCGQFSQALRGRAFLAGRGMPDLEGKNVRTELIGCILAAIEQSQTVLNEIDVR
jgi:hypothetical protein